MRVLIAGGGTGGHLYPGIAVARELHARVPGASVSFVGTSTGLEVRVIPREGYPLDVIRSGGLKGKSWAAMARGLALIPLSALDAWNVLATRKPDLVIGVGGFSSGPVVLLAAARRIPTMLLEQNAIPGLTNRLLARVVDAAAVTYDQTRQYFGGNAFVSGNPVRAEFFDNRETSSDEVGRDVPTRVLVFGGSQGAHAINMAMMDAAPILARVPALTVTHQTGERDVEAVRDAYGRAGLSARVEPYLYRMREEMSAADLAVCRAGATTLAEIAAAGVPAILIPLPTATDDHQRRNAEALVAQEAAVMVDQRELTGDRLAAEILGLATDGERRMRVATAVRRLARPDAARQIVDRALRLVAPDDAHGTAAPDVHTGHGSER